MAEAATSASGADAESSGDPSLLDAAADSFLSLSNVCDYLTSTKVIQGGGSLEYLMSNLDTDKQRLQQDWQEAVRQVTGMLLSGVEQFGDAAAALKMRATGFTRADS